MFLYVTSDKIGHESGGGVVTANELEALRSLGPVDVINPECKIDPFETEKSINIIDFKKYKLAHFYAGTYPELSKKLQENGVRITYTVAAHDVDLSREEFTNLGMPFEFPHLNDSILFEKYVSAYKNADYVICPSKVAEKTNQKYGCKSTIIIPHGCDPMTAKKFPTRFNVGYLGQIGPDKGIRYLLEAWAMLDYKDSILNLGGLNSSKVIDLIRYFNKGDINIWGWVNNVEDFYNSCSIYAQPSVTEGFGIEVLEAMNCGRPVIVSDGAGASDCIEGCGFVFEKRNVYQLCECINRLKNDVELRNEMSQNCKSKVKNYNWESIKKAYVSLWKGLLKNELYLPI